MKKILPLILLAFLHVMYAGAQCNPAFTSFVNQANAGFHAVDSNTQLLHTWRFGDGLQGFGVSTSHKYSTSGTYTVTHIISDSLNICRDSSQQSITINITDSCVASFTAIRDSLYSNRYIFTSTSQITTGNIQSYVWTVNGLTVSTQSTFNDTLTAGNNTVCLRIRTTTGCSSSSCKTITITAPPPCTINAGFTTNINRSNPLLVIFRSTPTGSSYRYEWNFGDGYTSVQQNPSHQYAQGGVYPVRLAIFDTIKGCYDTIQQNVNVAQCAVNFTYTTSRSKPFEYQFTATSSPAGAQQTWYITAYDSSYRVVLNENNPLHVFPDSGSYNVCVKTVSAQNCIAWYCNQVIVNGRNARNELVPSFPNPVHGNDVTMRLMLKEADRIRLTVYNTSGNVVYTTEKPGIPGANLISIPVSDLQRGQYFVSIRFGNEIKQSIFQKL